MLRARFGIAAYRRYAKRIERKKQQREVVARQVREPEILPVENDECITMQPKVIDVKIAVLTGRGQTIDLVGELVDVT